MPGDMIRLKAFRGDVAAEVEIPINLIGKDFRDAGILKNLLLQLYNAIDSSLKLEYGGDNQRKPEPSNFESELMHGHQVEPTEHETDAANEPAEYEPLSQVIKNDGGWREVERLLIIIFYASAFGSADFNREDINALYKETGRDTLSRRRNMTNNLQTLTKYKWIMASKSDDFYMTDEGIFRARGILARDKDPINIQN